MSHRWKFTLCMTVENRGLLAATKVWALEALSLDDLTQHPPCIAAQLR